MKPVRLSDSSPDLSWMSGSDQQDNWHQQRVRALLTRRVSDLSSSWGGSSSRSTGCRVLVAAMTTVIVCCLAGLLTIALSQAVYAVRAAHEPLPPEKGMLTELRPQQHVARALRLASRQSTDPALGGPPPILTSSPDSAPAGEGRHQKQERQEQQARRQDQHAQLLGNQADETRRQEVVYQHLLQRVHTDLQEDNGGQRQHVYQKLYQLLSDYHQPPHGRRSRMRWQHGDEKGGRWRRSAADPRRRSDLRPRRHLAQIWSRD